MRSSDENEMIRIGKEVIVEQMNNLVTNPELIKQNECAACHILFELVNKMHISELDATDLLSRILLNDPHLNDTFVEVVEDIHMKRRMMAIQFVLKSRNAKDKFIDSNFKNFLEEKSSELVNYGYDLVLRKLLISAIALEIAQNIGVDYHAAMEELYYYMRKNDEQTNFALVEFGARLRRSHYNSDWKNFR
jgi:hypothetical protein